MKTSFRSLCRRNCFRTKIRGGRTVYFYGAQRQRRVQQPGLIFILKWQLCKGLPSGSFWWTVLLWQRSPHWSWYPPWPQTRGRWAWWLAPGDKSRHWSPGSKRVPVNSVQVLVTYCSFVQDLDRIGAGHIALLQGLLQFLQWWVVPLSKHHQVNVTVTTNMRNIQNTCFSMVFPILLFNLNL